MISSRLIPNINWIRALVCPAVVFIAMSVDRGYQTDFWHHLARGRQIAEGGLASANVDTFTFTVAGQPVRDANWLTQLAYFRLFELGGFPLVQTFNALILAAGAGLLVWVCHRQSGSLLVAAVVGVLTFAGIRQTLLIRPQSLSLLLFIATYAILIASEQRRRLLILAPMLMALWTNLHGGFPIGMMLIGTFIAATVITERRRTTHATALSACLVACLLATLINPYGYHVYQYVFQLSAVASGRQIEEWLPPTMSLWVGRALAASVLGFIAMLVFAPGKPRLRDVLIALCFLPLACASVRMIPWWLLILAPVVATMFRRTREEEVVETVPPIAFPRALAASAMLLFLGACITFCTPWMQRFNPILGSLRPASSPEADIQSALNHLPGSTPARVFSRLEWGEYLDWAGHPQHRTFIDGRIEIYPNDLWEQYHAVTWARGDWQAILDRHGVDHLLLDSSFHKNLLEAVDASKEWSLVTRTGNASLFARRDPATTLTDVRD